jgi:carbonic anhydrase
MRLMAPAVEKAGPQRELSWPDYLTRLEQANIANSLDNLLTFPRLRKRVERGEIALHGAYFGVATGQLSVRDDATGEFAPVAVSDPAQLVAPRS